jgi:hypothetical protein
VIPSIKAMFMETKGCPPKTTIGLEEAPLIRLDKGLIALIRG